MGIDGKDLKRGVFLDRDGVLNAPVLRDGKPHPPSTLAEAKILDDVPQAVGILKNAGLLLAVITNQPDVARGTQKRLVVESINAWLGDKLSLDIFEVCYHDESDDCDCRKPKPGLIFRSAAALGLEAQTGFVVGDRWRDIDAGKAAGCRTVWIDRGYDEKQPTGYDKRAHNLLDAAQWIITQLH